MFKMNLQLFAHKKGVGSSRNGRDSESKRLGPKAVRTVSSFSRATSSFASAARTSIRATTWASVRTTRCLRRSTASFVSKRRHAGKKQVSVYAEAVGE